MAGRFAWVLNLDADFSAFPTPIIDQLAKQKGVLTELLGSTIDMQVTGRNLSGGQRQRLCISSSKDLNGVRSTCHRLKGFVV